MTRVVQRNYRPVILNPSSTAMPVAIAVLANLLIVSLPFLFWSRTVTVNSVVFLLASGLLCSCELTATAKMPEVLHTFGRYQKLAMTGAILLLLLQWCCLAESLNRNYDHSIAAISGFGITMTGYAIRLRGIDNLRTAFCSDLTNTTLVTTGIHSFIRHPSETGLFVAGIGIAVTTGSFGSAIAILPICWRVAHLRIAEEERWLHLQHGEAYATYCSGTGRWLPISTRL